MELLKEEQPDELMGVHCIDTKMNLLERYNSAYIMDCGGATVLVDGGKPKQWSRYTMPAIRKAGFDPEKIDYMFVTHEHQDHMGAAGIIARLNPNVTIVCAPKCAPYMMDTATIIAEQKQKFGERYYEKLVAPDGAGTLVPVPGKNIRLVDDGEIIDINGHKFQCFWTTGHRLGCASYHYLNKNVLFCSDSPGNCFVDAGIHYTLSGTDNNYMNAIKSMQRLMQCNADYLALGHYGFSKQPEAVLMNSIAMQQAQLDAAKKIMEENQNEQQAELLAEMWWDAHKDAFDAMIAFDNDEVGRGQELYHYAAERHLNMQKKKFAKYAQTVYFPELAYKG